jgi:hypothetical protein
VRSSGGGLNLIQHLSTPCTFTFAAGRTDVPHRGGLKTWLPGECRQIIRRQR